MGNNHVCFTQFEVKNYRRSQYIQELDEKRILIYIADEFIAKQKLPKTFQHSLRAKIKF